MNSNNTIKLLATVEAMDKRQLEFETYVRGQITEIREKQDEMYDPVMEMVDVKEKIEGFIFVVSFIGSLPMRLAKSKFVWGVLLLMAGSYWLITGDDTKLRRLLEQ